MSVDSQTNLEGENMTAEKQIRSTEYPSFKPEDGPIAHHTIKYNGAHSRIRPFRLIDPQGRILNYLRLAVTDRCNLRCKYCMPAAGIPLAGKNELLSWEEMLRLSRVFIGLGINKIRLTGGEPFIRRGLLDFLTALKYEFPNVNVGITTNGTLVKDYLDELKTIGIQNLNFSLDSLNEDRFKSITGQFRLKQVINSIEHAYRKGFTVKINMVVLPGINVQEIPKFVEWTRDRNWTVRFIEAMPFDTRGGQFKHPVNGRDILALVQNNFEFHPVPQKTNTVNRIYQVSGFRGKIGIINGFSRSFCQGCSRLRVSSRGLLRTCLYGKSVLDLKEMIRTNMKDESLMKAIKIVMGQRKKNGFEAARAQKDNIFDSMSVIGG